MDEIQKMQNLLDEHSIPYIKDCYVNRATRLTIHCGLYIIVVVPAPNGNVELLGGLTKRESKHDSFLQTNAEDAFKRIKYCYHHQTDVYKR